MEILFRHSRPEFSKKRRVTICCIIQGDKMRYGVAVTHRADIKKWSRKIGRAIAEGRALTNPDLETIKPEARVHEQFYKESSDIIIKEVFKGMSLDKILHKLKLRREAIEKQEEDLVSLSTRVLELFNGPLKKNKKTTDKYNKETIDN